MNSVVPLISFSQKPVWLAKCVFAFLFLLSVSASPLFGQEPKDAGKKEADIPVKNVVMFSSGVAFFEHAGEVEGNAQVEMKFDVKDINDLLKSMVLRDLDGGKISTVSLTSQDPITRTLQTFAIDLTSDPTLGSLLKQIRGEKVVVTAPDKIEGVIIGVETRETEAGDETIATEYLNLLTEEGLRSVNLDNVGSIQLANEKLDKELRHALLVLATSHSTDKKSVTLNFLGDGKRDIRIGYIQESPVWKTSYRLVFDDEDKPLLQGWAIVENTTEDDWTDVDLTLVSGRPISFVMDLYQPLYVKRPVVEPELYASVTPRIYEQDLANANADFLKMADLDGQGNGVDASEKRARELLAESKSESQNYSGKPMAPPVERAPLSGEDLAKSMQVAAQGGDVGELFRYEIATPVSLQRGRSAMLSIVNDSIEAKKLSIYNQSVHAKHPLNGFRIKNTTDLHLMQGPVTVFDGGTYAGDSRFADLQPGTERLMSYAMDLDVEVAPESTGVPQKLVKVVIDKGTLYASTKYTQQIKYTVKNSGKAEKTVLIEQGFDPSWTLITPKEPTEKTRDMYRFAVNAEPGKPTELTVKEEMTSKSYVGMTNLDGRTQQIYLSSDVVSDEVKTAIKKVQDQKAAINKVAAEKSEALRKIQVIEEEQSRIRQNMAKLPKDSDLYRRYVTKFTEEEDEIDALRTTVTEKTKEQQDLQDKLNDFISGLSVE